MSWAKQCPSNSFIYNVTQCACNPGHVLNSTGNTCELLRVSAPEAASVVGSGVSSEGFLNFAETIFAFDSIRKFTQSQAVFLEGTSIMVLSWLLFCWMLRFGKLGDGRGLWFRIRWWISRLDICFATRHWLDDQQFVKKRKTELGGTFSIASWMLFIGLFAALLYQIISNRTIEVHNVRATNAPDLTSFISDMEFNITAVSSMSCSHLRGLGMAVSGNLGFVDQKFVPLSNFVNHSCHNTSNGPTITLKCNSCPLIQDPLYISWQFVDLPNDPATAIGFQFNLTARSHAKPKYLSFVSGMLKNRSNLDDTPVTFRGVDVNILKFNLFPRIFRYLHDLKIVQPLFHEFLPGTSFNEISMLQASLQSSKDGLINTTLYINPLSTYIVEIDKQNILGPVSFLADLGGLYCFSICTFFYFLVQCEHRVKRLRNEDSILRNIRNRRKAQDHWDKLRKYVMYTWGCSTCDDEYNSITNASCCPGVVAESFHGSGLSIKSRKPRLRNTMNSLSFNKKVNLPSKKNASPECDTQRVKTCSSETALNPEGRLSHDKDEHVLKNEALGAMKNSEHENYIGFHKEDVSCLIDDYAIPPLPSLEYKPGSEISLSDIQQNLQNLYEYNVMLRDKFVATQRAIQALTVKPSTIASESQTS
ncbi:uncharacterized protein LOC131154015 [Malania oleifera]|uniref:uncharacterized protein LOC131154015 n=1 Tax=Malania oleifera TaxID=397392 RepID=UPI0025ADC208|nr:uncharacterized protein LOC131154015 [Malania oleifera]